MYLVNRLKVVFKYITLKVRIFLALDLGSRNPQGLGAYAGGAGGPCLKSDRGDTVNIEAIRITQDLPKSKVI